MPTYILILFKNCSKAICRANGARELMYHDFSNDRVPTSDVYHSLGRLEGNLIACALSRHNQKQQLASPIAGIGEWRFMASLLVRGQDGKHGHMLCECLNRLLL